MSVILYRISLFADFIAATSLRISLATMWNFSPCSPITDASSSALKAMVFVLSVTPSMESTIEEILFTLSLKSFI